MEPHPRERMKKKFHQLERERRVEGINIKPNLNLAKGERGNTSPK